MQGAAAVRAVGGVVVALNPVDERDGRLGVQVSLGEHHHQQLADLGHGQRG